MPYSIIRCAVSSTGPAPGAAATSSPSARKGREDEGEQKLVVDPRAETRRSPRTKLRNFRGLIGTGLAPPKVNAPLGAEVKQRGQQELIQGSM